MSTRTDLWQQGGMPVPELEHERLDESNLAEGQEARHIRLGQPYHLIVFIDNLHWLESANRKIYACVSAYLERGILENNKARACIDLVALDEANIHTPNVLQPVVATRAPLRSFIKERGRIGNAGRHGTSSNNDGDQHIQAQLITRCQENLKPRGDRPPR
jgi:hypothetical protein